MADGQGTGEGTTGAGTGQQPQTPPAWVAQLPTDLKGNEAFTKYPTIGDLGKSHLDLLGKTKELDGMTAKVGELEGKVSNSVLKLPKNPTKEQVEIYYSGLGRPAKATDYKFEAGEGVEHTPEMVKWGQETFHKFGLTQDQAQGIQKEWDQFLKGVEQEEDRLIQEEISQGQDKFRKEFKSDDEFRGALELNKRYYKKMMGSDIPPFMDAYSITKFIYQHAKKYGEDLSVQGGQFRGAGEVKPGMIYDKSPGLKEKR